MKLNTFIIILVINFNHLFSQMEITIYNENKAFINENREIILNEIGEQQIMIDNLPNEIEPSSITMFSETIKFISKEFFNKPISIKSILDESIGQEIELIKYGENGEISFSTIGKLISNNNVPIFEINDKIIIDPPYEYRFNEIPKGMKNSPYLHCQIQSITMNSNFNLLYRTKKLSWSAEYDLFLINNKKSNTEGWYAIKNNSNTNFNDAYISLMSGEINFGNNNQYPLNTRMVKMNNNLKNEPNLPNYFQTNEYHIFQIPKKINLKANSEFRYEFFSKNEISYEKKYHVSHSLQRYRKKISKTETIPINIQIELKAKDFGDFQLPSGIFKVYENANESFTFIGEGYSSIYEDNDIIKIETGSTRDILCNFSINSHEISRNHEETEIKALFTNKKNHNVIITWIEKFYDAGWEIFQTSDEYDRLDAYTAKYDLTIPANSKKEVIFKARIEKN